MNCPLCAHLDSRVIETRGDSRRRACEKCGHRWTTREVLARDAELVDKVGDLIRRSRAEA